LLDAAREAAPAHAADELRATLRHARISADVADRFWDEVLPVIHRFARLPRSGDTTYGFAVGLFATDFPTLPEPAGHDASS
jgi:hypothetical protein